MHAEAGPQGRQEPDATLAYGPSPDQAIDVFAPERPSDTLVVLIHGGFWRDPDRRGTYRAARALADAGRAAATVEYRRGPGRWAETAADVAALFDGLPGLLDGVLPGIRRVVALGHSAGGQLALWAASRSGLPAESPFHRPASGLAGVIGAAAAADLRRMSELGLGNDAVREFLGQADVGAAAPPADPIALQADVPVVLLHGSADAAVPVEISERYARGRSRARLEVVDGAGHLDWVDPDSVAWQRVLAALEELAPAQGR